MSTKPVSYSKGEIGEVRIVDDFFLRLTTSSSPTTRRMVRAPVDQYATGQARRSRK